MIRRKIEKMYDDFFTYINGDDYILLERKSKAGVELFSRPLYFPTVNDAQKFFTKCGEPYISKEDTQ